MLLSNPGMLAAVDNFNALLYAYWLLGQDQIRPHTPFQSTEWSHNEVRCNFARRSGHVSRCHPMDTSMIWTGCSSRRAVVFFHSRRDLSLTSKCATYSSSFYQLQRLTFSGIERTYRPCSVQLLFGAAYDYQQHSQDFDVWLKPLAKA